MKVRLPGNQTSTGYVTIAVFASVILLFGIALIAGPVGANSTFSITGAGICPFWRTVTVVRRPEVLTSWIDSSTDSVVNSQ